MTSINWLYNHWIVKKTKYVLYIYCTRICIRFHVMVYFALTENIISNEPSLLNVERLLDQAHI